MKYKIYYFFIMLAAITFISSCVKDPDPVTYAETNLERNDPLKQVLVNTPNVAFVAGEAGYGIEFIVITPNNDDTKQVNVYKTYTDANTGNSSNEALLKSYAVTAGVNTTTITDMLTYEQLAEGLAVNGGALPVDPVEIPVGSNWSLRLEPVNASGTEDFSAPGISVAVLSPFAGNYTVIESDYWRIGVQSGIADWTGSERFIGSVDANTFSHPDAWGPFTAADGAVGQFVFDLNPDNSITVIDDPSQLFFSGDDMLTCQNDGAMFANVPCAGSNVLIPSGDGKHIIKLTYGYFTNNSGPREFYEVLEKIVE